MWLAIISATLTAICIWWTGRLYERARNKEDKDAKSYIYMVEIEDEPEFKEHQLN